MPNDLMFSGRVYNSDNTRVPFYRYKCKSGHTVQGDDKKAEVTHTCKIVIDHDKEPHKCICGITWKNGNQKETADA